MSIAFAQGVQVIADRLDEAAERALDGRDRQSLFAAATRLRRESTLRVNDAADALTRRAQRCLDAAALGEEAGEMALVDDEELEQQIAAGDLAREIRERAGPAYPRYAARLRRLVEHDWRDDERNPLGARSLAGAALAGLAGVADNAQVRDAMRHLGWKTFAAPLAEAIVAAERQLEQMGVPDTPIGAPETAMPAAVEAPAEGAQVELAQAHVGGGAGDQTLAASLAVQAENDATTLGSSPLAGAAAGTGTGHRLRVLPILQPVLEIERDAVAFAHAIGAMPYSRQARSEFFGNVRKRLIDAGAAPAQVAVVDLVSAMFDYVIDDRRVPEAARPLVWRLQQPSIALTLLDPAYLGDDPRSLRRLVEHFGAITTAFADDIVRGSELYRRLETVVRAVEIVTSALQARSSVMAQQVEKEYARAARSVGQLIEHVVRERRALEETPGRRNRRDFARRPSREREEQVTGQLHAMLAERLQRYSAPDSVRDFVMNVWLRHLRTAALRDGEQSAEFAVSLRVVDDLLWSLGDHGERRSRRELAQRIPPLIRLLTQGLRDIGAKDDEFKPFFDELFLIHLRRMQRRSREDGASRIGHAPSPGSADGTRDALQRQSASNAVPKAADDSATAGDAESAPDAASGADAASGDDAGAGDAASASDEGDAADASDAGPRQRLFEILESLDLDDLPEQPKRCELDPQQAIERLSRGDWIELLSRAGESDFLKVAWINRRRTVVLLVRRSDRRATSLRIDELRERLAQARAFRIRR